MFKKPLLILVVVIILSASIMGCGPSKADLEAQSLLLGLNNKARSVLNQPGWVHVIQNIVYDTDRENRGTMATGIVIPLIQEVSIWYHINQEKLVYQYVLETNTPEGETIETTVFYNEMMYNLVTNTSQQLNPYSLGGLDFQFSDEVATYLSSSGNHLTVSDGDFNGKPVTIFTLDQKLDSPAAYDDFNQPVTGAGTIATFDKESGYLLKLQRIVTLQDGTRRNFFTDTITIETGVEPPLYIEDYVNGIW
jgi:hypothetical protein